MAFSGFSYIAMLILALASVEPKHFSPTYARYPLYPSGLQEHEDPQTWTRATRVPRTIQACSLVTGCVSDLQLARIGDVMPGIGLVSRCH